MAYTSKSVGKLKVKKSIMFVYALTIPSNSAARV